MNRQPYNSLRNVLSFSVIEMGESHEFRSFGSYANRNGSTFDTLFELFSVFGDTPYHPK